METVNRMNPKLKMCINVFRLEIGIKVYSKSAAIYRSNCVTTVWHHNQPHHHQEQQQWQPCTHIIHLPLLLI